MGLDRTIAPKAQMLDDLSLVEPQVFKAENGIQYHLLKDNTNAVAKIDVLFPFGKAFDDKHGQSFLCGKLLTESTLSYADGHLQETLDYYGAHVNVTVDYDHTTITLLCMKEHFVVLFPLLKSVLTEPSFEETDFQKVKSRQIQRLKVNEQKSSLLASKNMREMILNGTPYAEVLDVDDVNALELEDVKAFFEYFSKFPPHFILSGDVNETMVDTIRSTYDNYNYAKMEVPYSGKSQPVFEEREVKREGSVQASIRLSTLSIPKTDDDFYYLSITNEILGGYFGSRLMKNIREDKGYTYGIYSVLMNYKHIDYQVIGADVQLDNVDDAISEIKKELERMQTEPVSEEELLTVKNYMLGKLASGLDTIFNQADNYKAKIAESGDYKTYFDAYINAIHTITADQIQNTAKKYFSQKFCVVKVV